MEAQLQKTTHYEEDPHKNAALHPAGEHKSVLKKVKDKAKKIKDTIKKIGHEQEQDHDHDHEYRHDQNSEEDDDDEETVIHHGAPAPITESAFISGTNLPKQTEVNLEKGYNPDVRDEVYSDVGDRVGVTKTHIPGPGPNELKNPHSEVGAEPKVKMGPLKDLVEDPHPPNSSLPLSNYQTKVADPTAQGGREADVKNEVYSHVGDNVGVTKTHIPGPGPGPAELPNELKNPHSEAATGPKIKIAPLEDSVEDPHSPNNTLPISNNQTKVADPTAQGGREAFAPLVQHLDDLPNRDNFESKPEQRSYTRSHDQFVPQSTPINDQLNPEPNQESPKAFDATETESMPRDTVAGKISLATSFIADKAVSAKNVVASTLGYGGQDSCKKAPSESLTEYASGDNVVKDSGKGVSNQESPKAFDATETKSESMPRDTVAGKISLATSVIADKAVSAKNVVASTLGYGGQDSCKKAPSESLTEYASGDSVVKDSGKGVSNQESPKAFDATETESIPRDTVAGKISLATSVIADKAVSAKNVVASTLGYGGQDSCKKAPSESLTEYASGDSVVKDSDKGVSVPSESLTEYASGDSVVKDSDKGVSVKGYLIDKFSPGDEDKALSEAITDAMQKKKEGMQGMGFDKRMNVAAHSEKPAGGVVESVKGTVGSWLGMSSETNTAQHKYGPSGEERLGGEEVDPKLQISNK